MPAQAAARPLVESAPAFDPTFTFGKAAEYIGVSDSTLRRLVYAKQIACVRNGSRGWMRFRLSALNAYLKRNERRAKRGDSE